MKPQEIPQIINSIGKNNRFNMLVISDVKLKIIIITEIKEVHNVEASKGFFLYFKADPNPLDIPPKITHATDKISVMFIGFLNFKDSIDNT